MSIKVEKLKNCEEGDVVQFLSDCSYFVRTKIKAGMLISLSDYESLKSGHTKGIVISKTKARIKVLEFDSIGSNTFKGLLILSNVTNRHLLCKLNPIMKFDPIVEAAI